MPATISRDWAFQGFDVVRLENAAVIVDVIPALGGKIVHFRHKGLDREFFWHSPRQRLRALPVGAGYDDHFFGAWDELLPNDETEIIGGERWADHGELWTLPLDATVRDGALHLDGLLPINALRYERRMSLDGDAPVIRMFSRVTNVGRTPIDFLWKLHPALRISPGTEIVVPARTAIPVDPAFSRFGHLKEFPWPHATDRDGKPARADCIDRIDGTSEFLYLVGLEKGTCALANRAEDWRFAVDFPEEIFPAVWIFASYGGWRDLEGCILEPCTTWPKALSEAIPLARACHLDSGNAVEADITVRAGRYDEG